MKCNDCPMQWIESNESVYPAQTGCCYGADYEHDYIREFADGSWGCLKRYKTVLRDWKESLKAIGECPEYKALEKVVNDRGSD